VIEPIEIEFEVACSPEHAFDTWTGRTSLWWPRSHSMSSAPGLVVTFEARPGGRIYERTPDGTEHDWGEIPGWERLGTDAPAWRQRNLGGWSGLLPHFRQAAAAPPDSGAPESGG
jgi:hypothetical protein